MDNEADAVTAPMVAEIFVVPTATPVARPVVGLTVATVGVLETQLAASVKIRVVASEYVPVAVSC
jgi:hypothetical protein